jgi:hypothetical protein
MDIIWKIFNVMFVIQHVKNVQLEQDNVQNVLQDKIEY